jgi:hypothetical protein
MVGDMRVVALAAALLLVLAGCGSDDEAGSDESATTTVATTAPAESMAGDPFGLYEREVTQAEIDRTAATRPQGWEAPPPGTYRLNLTLGVLQVFDPNDLQISQELTVTDGTLEIGPYIGPERNAFCSPDGPAAYDWKFEEETLVLSPKEDACADRDSILTGSWSRQG